MNYPPSPLPQPFPLLVPKFYLRVVRLSHFSREIIEHISIFPLVLRPLQRFCFVQSLWEWMCGVLRRR
jgi:hypothetical protein